MGIFTYKARGANGAVTEGIIEAPERASAAESLRSQRLIILELNQRKRGLTDAFAGFFRQKGDVSSKDLVLFSRQFATLVSAGVPIVRGLGILERQTKNPYFKEVLAAVRMDIEGGLSITDALQKHPDAFPTLYTSMVKAGELGGILDTILERLSAYLEAAEQLRAKVRSALMYPAIVLSICGGVTVFLLVFVIPTFQKIFASLGKALPVPTQMLVDISSFFKTGFPYFIPVGVALWLGAKRFYASNAGRRWTDARLLDLPLFGLLIRKAAVARFARTLGTLLKSGVPILQALETVADTAGNAIIAEAVLESRGAIREGGTLSAPLERSGVFPELVTSMIAVGEETGSLDIMLAKIADFYDAEVDTDVKGLSSLIEPIVIVIMGLIVGTIVVAMFLPIIEGPGAVGD